MKIKKQISFTDLIKFSFNKLYRNFGIFFDVAFVPFFIVLILSLWTAYNDEFVLNLFEKKGIIQGMRGSVQTRLVEFFIVTPLISVFLVSWHRFIIFNGKKPWKLSKFDLSKYTFVFIWAIFKLWLVTIVPLFFSLFLAFMLFSKVPGLLLVVGIISYLAFIFFSTRLLLILPAAATEQDISLKRIYMLSKGNFWKIFLIFILSFIFFFILLFCIAFLIEIIFPSDKNIISWFIINFITQIGIFLYCGFNAGCLSKIYIELKK